VIAIGPTSPIQFVDFCSLKKFSEQFNHSLDLGNSKFCENNYCNNYTLSSLSEVNQSLIFFVTEYFSDQ
jgi:hypothetical protein